MVTAIIIDDENGNIRYLQGLLNEYCKQVVVKGTFNGIKEAATYLDKEKIDLIFLDVELNNELGFKLFDFFPSPGFQVVFTTAHEKYALSAIKTSCLEYLLKPINYKELVAAVEKFEKQKQDVVDQEKIKTLLENLNSGTLAKIAVPSTEGYTFITATDIVCCEASMNYTVLYTIKNEKIVSTKSLKEFEELLNPKLFFRCHKSWIINLNFIKKYLRSDAQVTMSNDMKIDVAVRKKEEFLKLFF